MRRTRARSLRFASRSLLVNSLLGWSLLACTRISPEEGLVDAEYQYHRVGNRKATYAELQDMQKREELHISQLQAEIELQQQRERELATEREAKEASLRLLSKDAETAKREVEQSKAELEAAITARKSLEIDLDNTRNDQEALHQQIEKAKAEVNALRDLLSRTEAQALPDKERLSALLESLAKQLSSAPASAQPAIPAKPAAPNPPAEPAAGGDPQKDKQKDKGGGGG